MKALIDFDVITYRAGFSAQKVRNVAIINKKKIIFERGIPKTKAVKILEFKGYNIKTIEWDQIIEVDPLAYALNNAKMSINGILKELDTSDYIGYLSDPSVPLVRASMAKTKKYKGNRDDFLKPYYYSEIREYLCNYYNTELSKGIEADDAMSIAQCKEIDKTVICSIDKDLLQIPGHHYNFVKETKSYIDETSGWKNFYKQVLTGDRADNIPGIKGIGDKRAEKLLFKCTNNKEMYNTVSEVYKKFSEKEDWYNYLLEICNLCYIWRKENDKYEVPE